MVRHQLAMALAAEANLPSTEVGFLQIIVGGVMSATLIFLTNVFYNINKMLKNIFDVATMHTRTVHKINVKYFVFKTQKWHKCGPKRTEQCKFLELKFLSDFILFM
jgi:hypothetical protein